MGQQRPRTFTIMINNSLSEYIFIRVCIVCLHSITPIALTYCALVLVSFLVRPLQRFRVLPVPVWVWLAAESLFFLLVFLPRYYVLQHNAVHPESLPRAEREELFERCDRNIPDPEVYLQKWFGDAKKEEIKRENVKEFLSWAFFDTRQVQPEDEEQLQSFVTRTEQRLGRRIPEGKGNAISLRLTLDEVRFLHRSLLWYWVSCGVSFVVNELWIDTSPVCRSCRLNHFFPPLVPRVPLPS